MKHIKYIIIVLFALIISANSNAQCIAKPIVKEHKKTMKPYSLDTYTDNELVFGKALKSTEIPFSAYSGDLYRLVFVPENVPQAMTIAVYDRNIKSATRKQLFIYEVKVGSGPSEPFLINKPGNYYIQFDVPAADDGKIKKMCLFTLIGYKEQE